MLFRSPTKPKAAPSSPPKSPTNLSQIFAKFRNTTQPKVLPKELSSGEPQTHPQLAEEGVCSQARVPVEQVDNFVCFGAVDVPKLIRGSRASLLSKATALGATCLVDEQYVSLPNQLCRQKTGQTIPDGDVP